MAMGGRCRRRMVDRRYPRRRSELRSSTAAPPATEVEIVLSRWACVVRLGGVGDDIIASSVAPLLKRQGYMVEFIAAAPCHVVLQNNPHIDKITVPDQAGWPTTDGGAWQRMFAARAKEYDWFVNLSHSIETMVALQVGQTQFWHSQEYRRKMCAKNYLEHTHEICGLPMEFDPRFYPTEEEKAQALETRQKVGERYVAWILGGTRIDKVYPFATHAIARIIRELDIPVVMLGAPGKDFEMAKAIEQNVEWHNSSGKGLHLGLSPDPEKPTWGIRRVLTMAQGADLVISPDTGPAWACAMEAMPKIVLLSHASEQNITAHWNNTTTLHADPARVPCWPCHRLHDDPTTCVPSKEGNSAACMADIKVEAIVSTAKRLLEKTAPTSC